MTITVTINLNDAAGVDSRFLFPGSIASSTTIAVGNGELLYQSGGQSYDLKLSGSGFALGTPESTDVSGNVSGMQLFGPGASTATATLWVTNNGSASTIPVNSVASLTPTGLLNIVSFNNEVQMVINGGAGDDKLFGSQYHDILTGNDGHDILHGFGSNDTFQFNSVGKQNSDHVTDFAHLKDTIGLDSIVFHGITDANLDNTFHNITKGGFAVEEKNDRILYDRDTGKLWYDADGNRDGDKPELVAIFDNHTKLDSRDFGIVV
jgi:Ca2+-binding RTX toxin-like protein